MPPPPPPGACHTIIDLETTNVAYQSTEQEMLKVANEYESHQSASF